MKEKNYRILFLGRILIGLVFAYSGYTKLMEPVENFQAAIAAYEIIPYGVVPLIAHVIPWMEIIFGAMMLVGYMTRVSALVLVGMSLSFVFLILITKIMTGALPSDCGCFGEGSLVHLKPLEVFVLDIINTIIGIKLLLIKTHSFSLDSFLIREN